MVIELVGELDPEEVSVLQGWLRGGGWPALRMGPQGPPPSLLLLVLGEQVDAAGELARRQRARLAPEGRLLALVRRLDADAYLEVTAPPWHGILERPLLLRRWNETLRRTFGESAG
jgi:hypothetical protein